MTRRSSVRSTLSYLSLVGTFSRWPLVLLVAMAAYIGYARFAGSRLDTWLMLLLVLLPIGAGTGLLEAARRGELDLLFGSGVTRSTVWWTALGRTVLVPIAVVLLLVLMSGSRFDAAASAPAVAGRVGGTLVFTCGLCFAAGLGPLRNIGGALWMIVRFVAFIIEPFRETALSLAKPDFPRPSAAVQTAVTLVIPELLLTRIAPTYVVLFLLMGTGALVFSYRQFSHADLGGKRR